MIKPVTFIFVCLSVLFLAACGSSSSSSTASSTSTTTGGQATTATTASASSDSGNGTSCDDFALAGAKAGAKVNKIQLVDGATCDEVKSLASSSSVLQKATDINADGYTCTGIANPDTDSVDYDCGNGDNSLTFNVTGL